MNYLAHILLSGSDPGTRVGGLLGDFVKGPLAANLPPEIETGIRLHRRIDAITDSHPEFLARLAELPPPWRRYGGILLDVYFDHLLASQWREFHHQPLAQFCREFYQQLAEFAPLLPQRALHFSTVAPKVGWLEGYGEASKIPPMLDNLGTRLRRPVALGQAWPELDQRRRELDQTFRQLLAEHRQLANHFLNPER